MHAQQLPIKHNAYRISLLGKVGVGKSFLAQRAARVTSGIVLPIAKDVYRLAEAVLGRPVDKSQPGDRDLLKMIGTAWGRDGTPVPKTLEDRLGTLWRGRRAYADVWIDSFQRYVAETPPQVSIFNDDTRFPNELCRGVLELNFVPLFVACTEEQRLRRLRQRGENISDSIDHKSERLNAALSKAVLQVPLVTVIWNDSEATRPTSSWILSAEEFLEIIKAGKDLEEFTKLLPCAPHSLCEWARRKEWTYTSNSSR